MIDGLDGIKGDRERLLAELRTAGATKIKGGALCCPFCGERNPSGSVHEDRGGGTFLYTCKRNCGWNAGKSSGDVVAVVQRRDGLDFRAACERLGLSNGRAAQNGRKPSATATTDGRGASGYPPASESPDGDGNGPDAAAVKAAERRAAEAAARLAGDDDAAQYLWWSRAIDPQTAERLGLGIEGDAGSRRWTFPVRSADGTFHALKSHAADGQTPKGLWQPSGVSSARCWPVSLDGAGPVWLCPGELKAGAVIGCGLPAVGITCGEKVDLPADVFRLLAGRGVAIVPDDDSTGRAWGAKALEQLRERGIDDVRIVDLGLSAADGVKDVEDLIVRRRVHEQRTPSEVARELLDAWDRADEWFGTDIGSLWADDRTWRSVTIVSTGLARLDAALDGGLRTGGVHLVTGKPKQGKSTLAVAAAINAARRGFPVGICSLELDRRDVGQIIAASLGNIPRGSLSRGRVSGEYGDALRHVIESHGDMPLQILDDDRWPSGLNRNSLAEYIERGAKRFGWKLVVIDYAGLLLPLPTDRGSYDTDLQDSTALKRIARRNDVAILAVATLRKATKFAKPEEVTLDDVAGAGRLTYDATNVLFVWKVYGDANAGLVNVRVLASRFSGINENDALSFRWRPRFGRIENLEEDNHGAIPD